MTKTKHAGLLLGFTLLFSLSANALASPSPPTTGTYINATTYMSGAQLDAWYSMTRRLKSNFDNICADSFCGGYFSNIEALRYNCSVDQTTGHIGMCAWTFAASNEEVDPISGSIVVEKGSWRCRTPLDQNIGIAKLITALAGSTPLHAPLPGSRLTILDGLVNDCFF
ncbi:hypothetical protein [Pseudoxanthomonas sp. UTMC 1351]|uniref:hypothetical protein n=1 Tax=Pseudoxanthomonas sp. UTMC 1351 TaxID=2695853 RepID=UPI0034CD6D09